MIKFNKGFFFIFLAAALWSSTGVFSRALFSRGLDPLAVGFWRNGAGVLLLLAYLFLWNRRLLKISPGDIPFFAGFGLISIAFFNYFYLTTINLITITGAAVLLYTAPAFAALLALCFLREPMTLRKISCIALALGGAFLVVEGYDASSLRFNLPGVTAGLAAAFTYAAYSVFGRKAALADYHYWTVVFYSMLFGTFFLSLALLPRGFYLPLTFGVVAPLLLFSLLTVVLAYGIYNRGLKDVEAGKASIAATSEVVMALLWGVFFFKEALAAWQVLGVLMVLGAAFFIQSHSGVFSAASGQDT